MGVAKLGGGPPHTRQCSKGSSNPLCCRITAVHDLSNAAHTPEFFCSVSPLCKRKKKSNQIIIKFLHHARCQQEGGYNALVCLYYNQKEEKSSAGHLRASAVNRLMPVTSCSLWARGKVKRILLWNFDQSILGLFIVLKRVKESLLHNLLSFHYQLKKTPKETKTKSLHFDKTAMF